MRRTGMAVRFGRFEFDPLTGGLTRDGVAIRLQPQPARVLALLVARPGNLVTREEIRGHVWGSDTYVDFERGLNFCVAQIRSALGDSADSPRYVETVPKRGYRFIAPVSEAGTPAGAGLKAGPSARIYMLIAAGLLFFGALFFIAQRGAAPQTSIPIAVVPFDNQTGSGEYDRVAEGLADTTVAELTQSDRPRLAVIGNAAILRRARGFRDVKAIGAELRVDYVVLGQVQRDGERVRVVAHLIRVSDERHLWANRFDRPDLTLAVQEEIAGAIAREVALRLQPTD
jgi:TolB-like protein/DNA-binding winged helix-turn-helix (wHTH) protein